MEPGSRDSTVGTNQVPPHIPVPEPPALAGNDPPFVLKTNDVREICESLSGHHGPPMHHKENPCREGRSTESDGRQHAAGDRQLRRRPDRINHSG